MHGVGDAGGGAGTVLGVTLLQVLAEPVVWLAGWLGAVQGSFQGVVSERVPAGRSLVAGSRCRCGARVPAVALLPVAGWLLLRGRAGCCGQPIPVRYPVGEAALGAAWAGLAGAVAVGLLAWPLAAASAAGAAGVHLAVSWRGRPSRARAGRRRRPARRWRTRLR